MDSYLTCDLRGLGHIATQADAVAASATKAHGGLELPLESATASWEATAETTADHTPTGSLLAVGEAIEECFPSTTGTTPVFWDSSIHRDLATHLCPRLTAGLTRADDNVKSETQAVARAFGASLRYQGPSVAVLVEDVLSQRGGEILASALRYQTGLVVVALRLTGPPDVQACAVASACGVEHRHCLVQSLSHDMDWAQNVAKKGTSFAVSSYSSFFLWARL